MMFALDSVLPTVCVATLLTTVLCMHASAQQPGDADARDLLAKVDRKRLTAEQAAAATLCLEGTYTVTFPDKAADQPVAQGAFRQIFVGDGLARLTMEMGSFGKMEKGVQGDVVWEVDPEMGAKVHRGNHAAATRRYNAWMRGAPVSGLYESAVRTGTETVAGHQCAVVKLAPKSGTADVAYVDGDGVAHRIDIALPVPESAEESFGIDDAMLAQITFADWNDIGGVAYPLHRSMRMGPATVALVCKDIRAGVEIAAAEFVPPAAIGKAKRAPVAEPAFDAEGKPTYQIVEREAQPVVSIRVKCKPSEITRELGTILPEVMNHLTVVGATHAGPPFSRYHAWGETEIDLEAGIPVTGPVQVKGRLQNSSLPAGKAVTAWHIGPYEQLTVAYEGLRRYLDAHQYVTRGGPWELYWTDPGMVPDKAKWRTQLFAAIE